MQQITVARGIAVPFYPMRPAKGLPLRLKSNREKFVKDYLKSNEWVVQPKLNGVRAVLAVSGKRVYVFNRHLNQEQVVNAAAFIKHMPDKTVFDGEILGGVFYPFEALAISNQNFMAATTSERTVLAYQFTRLMGLTWLFGSPTPAWLMKGKEHAPKYDGVVMKRAAARYRSPVTSTQETFDWLKCRWV